MSMPGTIAVPLTVAALLGAGFGGAASVAVGLMNPGQQVVARSDPQRVEPDGHDPPSASALDEGTMPTTRERLATHAAQEVDSRWADRTVELLGEDLSALASKDMSVVAIDCRTTSCVVTMGWPSYDVALAEWELALHHLYRVNCDRSISLSEPEDPSLGFQAKMLFSCEGWRSGGSIPIG